MAVNENSRLQSGAELKMAPSSRTLSAPVSDGRAVFAYSITDEVNKMQYLSNTLTFQKRATETLFIYCLIQYHLFKNKVQHDHILFKY